jgi:CrcB protein
MGAKRGSPLGWVSADPWDVPRHLLVKWNDDTRDSAALARTAAFSDNSGVTKLAAILIGGGVGSVCRYLCSGVVQHASGGLFPLGTLVVNTLGCLLVGGLAGYFAGPHLVREEVRLGLLIGLIGGFTTFSTFAWETLALAGDGQTSRALANILLQNGLGLTAVWIGYRAAFQWFGA